MSCDISPGSGEITHLSLRRRVLNLWERLVLEFEASAQARGAVPANGRALLRRASQGAAGQLPAGGVEASGLTRRHLERLAARLLRAGRSRQSVKTYMSAINRFLGWCREEGELARLREPQPSVDRRVLDGLTREEIQRIGRRLPPSATA